MKEAFGGIFNLAFLIVFLVIVIGVLGLTFSYTKAFKMKNAVVSAIEEYEGNICHNGFRRRVESDAESLGYSPTNLSCPDGFTPMDNFFCYQIEGNGVHNVKIRGVEYQHIVFHVVTQFDIHFPIIEQIMSIHFFQVRGDTGEIYFRGNAMPNCS